MDLNLTRRDRWFIGAMYGIPISVLICALVMAFNHARNWADRHSDGPAWEHWAFAATIELPALLGLLLLTLWPKIGGGKKKTIPRLLFGSAAVLSFVVQQAYAGSDAAMSARIVAGLPSFAAGLFLEIVFWVMGLVEEAKQKAAEEVQKAALNQTRQQLGLGDIAAPPTLTSPSVSPPRQPDMSPPTPEPVSPDTAPDMSPDISTESEGHVGVTSPNMSPDISQVTTHVAPDIRSGNPWADMGGISPDAEAAERVVTLPDVAPHRQPDTDMSPDTQPAGWDTDVTPTPDMPADDVAQTPDTVSPDTDEKRMTDPRWAEAAEMRLGGATVKAIAARFNVSERQVQRWKLPTPDAAKPANGKVPYLTGVN